MMQTLPILYKITSTGKIRQWSITAQTGKTYPYYTVRYGERGGKIQETCTDVKVGKNIGKSNETTPYEQCCLEAASLWTKKECQGGYSTSIPTERVLKPMLAKSYDKDGRHIKFPCFVQPKLDGSRMIAFWSTDDDCVKLVSRQNKEITSMEHIQKALTPLLNKNQDLILDGELYIHDPDITFQDLMSAIKRDKSKEQSKKIEYHVYDYVDNIDYGERLKKLYTLNLSLPIRLVQTKVCGSGQVDDHWKEYTQIGYEGIMLRNKEGGYKIDGRSADLQKYKKFMDEEFKIVDAEQNKGRQSNQCTLICQTKTGKKFGCKPKGDEKQREQYWKDWKDGKLKGKLFTVRFFSWTDSADKVPRFPVGISIQDDHQ